MRVKGERKKEKGRGRGGDEDEGEEGGKEGERGRMR